MIISFLLIIGFGVKAELSTSYTLDLLGFLCKIQIMPSSNTPAPLPPHTLRSKVIILHTTLPHYWLQDIWMEFEG